MTIKTKNEYSYIARMASKLKAIELLGGKCLMCGEANAIVLEFHHYNDNKECNLARLFSGYRWSKIKKEANKCILLCRNCHNCHHDSDEGDNRLRELKLSLIKILNVSKCSDCGLMPKSMNSIEFHHINKSKKNITISKELNSKKTITQKILKEIENCEVLCGNCHKMRHFDKNRFEKYFDEIHHKKKNLEKTGKREINTEEILNMYEKGVRQIDICNLLNYPKSTVSTIIKRNKT